MKFGLDGNNVQTLRAEQSVAVSVFFDLRKTNAIIINNKATRVAPGLGTATDSLSVNAIAKGSRAN